jgi:Clp amino terminal domain, pathogenicity island component
MFERYTEKARRVIFYARYEASQYGSPYIETEHLLLGLLREDFATVDLLIPGAIVKDRIRARIEHEIPPRERISTSIEVPLTKDCKRVLNLAAEEAEKCGHRHIGTEHLLLGLLRVEEGLAYRILGEHKPDLLKLEGRIRKLPRQFSNGIDAAVSGWKSGLAPFSRFEGPEQFLNSLRAGDWQELSELLAEQSLFVDAEGKAWSGRKEISANLASLLAAFATKNARHHLISEISHIPTFWLGLIRWERIHVSAHSIPGVVQMTLGFALEKGEWRASFVQITAVAEPDSMRKTAAS